MEGEILSRWKLIEITFRLLGFKVNGEKFD